MSQKILKNSGIFLILRNVLLLGHHTKITNDVPQEPKHQRYIRHHYKQPNSLDYIGYLDQVRFTGPLHLTLAVAGLAIGLLEQHLDMLHELLWVQLLEPIDDPDNLD